MAIRPGKNISDFFICQSLGQTVSRNFLLPSYKIFFKNSYSTSNFFMNGDYITNGNMSHHHRHHHESNGSTSPELGNGSKSPQHDSPTIRDNIEDELDAEMAEVSVPSSGLSGTNRLLHLKVDLLINTETEVFSQ